MKRIIWHDSDKKYVGKTWEQLVQDIEDNSEFKVDGAYRNHPDQWIVLLDKDGNWYDAEVTEYYSGTNRYELMDYNITPNYQ